MARTNFINVLAFIALLLILAGCVTGEPPRTITLTETVEVEIPVPVARKPPDALLVPVAVEVPVFVSPDDPQASSALTQEGEKRLQDLILSLKGYMDASRAWMLSE